jgi:hypothetical protein
MVAWLPSGRLRVGSRPAASKERPAGEGQSREERYPGGTGAAVVPATAVPLVTARAGRAILGAAE